MAKRSLFSRSFRWLAAAAGAGLATASPVAAQTIAPSAAPVEWVRYAEGATAAVTRLLEADNETALRFRTYLHRTRPAEEEPTPPLELKIWVDESGVVSRMEFTPFAHAEPGADLRSLVVGQRLPGEPPADMLLPMRIAIQLDAPAAPPPTPTGGAPKARSGLNRT